MGKAKCANYVLAEFQIFLGGRGKLKTEPQIELEYFEISDADTLQPIADYKQAQSAVACIALKLGNVRLIDNVVLY